MAFINRLSEILEKKGISQYKLCKDLEIGQSTISSWKKGKMPTVEKIIAIVRYLEISADWLLEINTNILNLEEQELIEAYRNSDERGRRTILQFAKNEATQSQPIISQIGINNGKVVVSDSIETINM